MRRRRHGGWGGAAAKPHRPSGWRFGLRGSFAALCHFVRGRMLRPRWNASQSADSGPGRDEAAFENHGAGDRHLCSALPGFVRMDRNFRHRLGRLARIGGGLCGDDGGFASIVEKADPPGGRYLKADVLRYLFCLPRYHTNAVPWVRILTSAGHHVAVDVVETSVTENHALVSPNVTAPSALSRMIMRRRSSNIPNSPFSFPGVFSYWKRLQAEDPDVVIIRGVTRWFCRVAALCSILQGRRLVIYDQEDAKPSAWSGTWVRRAVFHGLGIPHFTSRLSPNLGPAKLGDAMSLPFGSPFEPARTEGLESRPLQWPPRILMVAKYRERKGHSLLLRALSAISSMPFSLTFCGEEATNADTAFCQALRREAQALGVADRLRFQNNIAHDDMISVFSGHDLLILPSRAEPAAVSPIEAAWAGCAVLMSRDSGTRYYMPEGAAFDFNPDDPQDIARAVARLIARPQDLGPARDACFARISSLASDDEILRLFETFGPGRTRLHTRR
ncbi:glycosyltransferase family 4 protein [Mesorhizobium sp. B2-6-4]|nr:glycosyltransferase family 4 protein [Mesorhizobium sp. B2-6-4]